MSDSHRCLIFVGTAVSCTHIVVALRCWFRGSTSKLQLRNSDTHSESLLGRCRLHRGGHNIDYRSVPQFPPRVSCVHKLENLEKPYLLIRFLWFICKVSSFFRTFTKQSIVDSNNITLTAVREKRKTKPRGNKQKCVCTLVPMHVRKTSKWCTKRNAGSDTRYK